MKTTTENRAAMGRVLALGFLLAALIAACVLLSAKTANAATTFTVNHTGDAGDKTPGDGRCFTGFYRDENQFVEECTLRAAMEEANANDNDATGAVDEIHFNLEGEGPHSIFRPGNLPTITEPVTIDGYTQPGASSNTKAVGNDAVLKIELSGAAAGQDATGLRIAAANTTVKGLVINRWGNNGISISGSAATGNKVEGNYIGTDASGTQNLGNGHSGFGAGVRIVGAPNNTIGGTTAGARNIISANAHGVSIGGSGFAGTHATGNKVEGNYIGTDRTGTAPLGNSFGVRIVGAPNTTVGGTQAGARNVISANNVFDGVSIEGDNATGNKVEGNYIGTDASGRKDLGNARNGVRISALNTTVGGTQAAARNVIAYNGSDGVGIYDFSSSASVLRNSIFSNTGLGMDLGFDGPDANDFLDADTGPNGLQNFPVLASAETSAGKTTIEGSLQSNPNEAFTIRFFSNPPDTNEGKKFIGQKQVTTTADGLRSFAFEPKKAVAAGQEMTATATDSEGNTSEFSAARRVVAQ